jgi:hypothetical protein
MRHVRQIAVALAAAAAMGGTAACSNDSTGTGGVNLVGNYGLVTLLLGGFLPATGSTGTLVFTSSAFDATINLKSPDTSLVHDTLLSLVGSYTAKHTSSGDSIYLVLGVPLGTIAGTFDVSGAASDTLALTLQTPLGVLGTIWHKP